MRAVRSSVLTWMRYLAAQIDPLVGLQSHGQRRIAKENRNKTLALAFERNRYLVGDKLRSLRLATPA
jgi:hypothetical protein